MKKILMTASSFGHFQSFHLPYFVALAQEGYQVDIACPLPPNQTPPPGVTNMLHLPYQKSILSPKNWSAINLLRNHLKKNHYDKIICHTTLAACFTRMALQQKNHPFVINMVHGYLFHEQSNPLQTLLYRGVEQMLSPKTDLILTMNDWDYNQANRYHLAPQIHPINGIGIPDLSNLSTEGLRESLNLPENTILLIFGGEFSKRKNQSFLIEAMTELPNHYHLALAGTGKLLPHCQELVKTLNLAQQVHFLGHVSNLPAWYKIADLVVSASKSEGLAVNILEANGVNTPTLISDIKGHREISSNLYQTKAQYITKITEKKEKRERESEKYELTQVLPQILTYYTAEEPPSP